MKIAAVAHTLMMFAIMSPSTHAQDDTTVTAASAGTPCPALSSEQVRDLGLVFTGGYKSGIFSLQNRSVRGRRSTIICVSHDRESMDCTVADPGAMHVKIRSADTYFLVPQQAIVELLLKNDKLSCTIK